MTDATFDPIAELYDKFAGLTHGRYQKWLEQVLPTRGERAVDLGCGSGRFLDLLANRYKDVLAVDASPRMINLARDRHPQAHIRYSVSDLWSVTPDRDGTFDLVFSVNTLHHLGPDPQQYLAHVRQLLRPGGQLVVIDCVQHTPPWATNAVTYRVFRFARTVTGATNAWLSGRSLGDALASYRLRRHPRWQRLAAEAPTLSRTEFHQQYAEALPGASFTDGLDPSVCAVRYGLPVTHPPTPRTPADNSITQLQH